MKYPFNLLTDTDAFQFNGSDSEEVQVWNEDHTEAMEVCDFLTKYSDTPVQEEAIEDVKKVVFGISYFVVFFHFVFRAFSVFLFFLILAVIPCKAY